MEPASSTWTQSLGFEELSGAPTWEPCTVGPGRGTQVHPSIKSYSCGHCLSERELPGRGHRGSQGVGPLDYPLASPD